MSAVAIVTDYPPSGINPHLDQVTTVTSVSTSRNASPLW